MFLERHNWFKLESYAYQTYTAYDMQPQLERHIKFVLYGMYSQYPVKTTTTCVDWNTLFMGLVVT